MILIIEDLTKLPPHVKQEIEGLVGQIQLLLSTPSKPKKSAKEKWENDTLDKIRPIFDAFPTLTEIPLLKWGKSPEHGGRDLIYSISDEYEVKQFFLNKDLNKIKKDVLPELAKIKLKKPKLDTWYGKVREPGDSICLSAVKEKDALSIIIEWEDME